MELGLKDFLDFVGSFRENVKNTEGAFRQILSDTLIDVRTKLPLRFS